MYRLSILPALLLILTLNGCAALGIGAAAAVGGCSVLDANDDDVVTEAEAAEGLFTDWDANDNDVLSEKEFDVGAQNTGVVQDWAGGFESWDENGDEELTREEFAAGVESQSDAEDWADSQCDDLGL